MRKIVLPDYSVQEGEIINVSYDLQEEDIAEHFAIFGKTSFHLYPLIGEESDMMVVTKRPWLIKLKVAKCHDGEEVVVSVDKKEVARIKTDERRSLNLVEDFLIKETRPFLENL